MSPLRYYKVWINSSATLSCACLSTYNHFHNILRLWRFTKFSFHHKWNDARLLLTNMLYTSCRRVPNELRFRILGNLEISGMYLNPIGWKPSAQPPCQNSHSINTSEKPLKNINWTSPAVRHFTRQVGLAPNIPWPLQPTQDPFKLNSFDNFGNSKALYNTLT